MKLRFILGAIVALATVAPTDAHAWSSFSSCAPAGTLQTCASFEVKTEAISGRTQVYVRVRNDGIFNAGLNAFTHGSALTRFGVLSPELTDVQFTNIGSIGSPNTIFADGATVTGDPAARWSTGNGNLNSLGSIWWGVSTQNPRGGINSCIAPAGNQHGHYFTTCGESQWVVFAFNTSNALNASDFQLAWGVVSASHDGGSYQGSTCIGPDCPGLDTVVPEPISMVLLGTGLAGVAAARRRRRKDDVLSGADDSEDDR